MWIISYKIKNELNHITCDDAHIAFNLRLIADIKGNVEGIYEVVE